MPDVLSEIANDTSLSPRTRLRLFLEAARNGAGTDVLTCHIGRDLSPYPNLLDSLCEEWRMGAAAASQPIWPFFSAGVRDHPALDAAICPPSSNFAGLTPNRWYTPAAYYAGAVPPYSFAHREAVSDFFHTVTSSLPIRLCFNARRGSPAAEANQLIQVNVLGLCERAADSLHKSDFAYAHHWALFQDQVVQWTKHLSEPNLYLIRQYFSWLIYVALGILDARDGIAIARCVVKDPEGDGSERLLPLSSRPAGCPDVNDVYRLRSVAISRAGQARSGAVTADRDFRKLHPYFENWKLVPQFSESGWRPRESADPPMSRRARGGIAALSAHWARPLYIADVLRRYNAQVPWYGDLFAELEPRTSSSTCIPLIKISPAGVNCFGVVAVESSRRRAFRRSRLVFLSYLFAYAASQIPPSVFEAAILIPPHASAM